MIAHRDVEELAGRHAGETAYIVGRGPSLLKLTRQDFGPGPVFALNGAIVQVRRLELPNQLYSMQQDGCLFEPIPPETVLLSRHLSIHCWPDYAERYLFTIPRRASMSTPCAVRVAITMGVRALVMLGHDAYRHRSTQVVGADGKLSDERRSFPGYVQGAKQSIRLAQAAGIQIRWRR